MADLPNHQWIETEEDLQALGERLRSCTWVALDSESNSGFVYEERLCLLQINTDDRLWAVDLTALPLGRNGLDPIRDPLEDPAIRVVLHGGEFDVGCLKRDYDLSLRGVWDSQQAASFLGWEKTGYGAVVEEVCGVKLPKDFARYNWGKRPLDPAPLRYALDDVHYLPRVGRRMFELVEEADLLEEVEIANRVVEGSTWNGGFRPEGALSLKGARALGPESRSVLWSLYSWRNSVARELDLPAGRVINNATLLALSRNPATTLEDLKKVGLSSRIRSRFAGELLQRIAEARRVPPPIIEATRRERPDPEVQRRGDRLKVWRRGEASRRGVPLQVVLPVVAMRHLQRHGAVDLQSVPQLGPKRIDRYGRELEKVCQSRVVERT
jgi:ribonuclease D